MSRLSKLKKEEQLRQGRGSELVAGGVWYFKSDKGDFEVVISDIDFLDKGYRKFCKEASSEGRMYLNREKPGYSLMTHWHTEDKERMDYYRNKK